MKFVATIILCDPLVVLRRFCVLSNILPLSQLFCLSRFLSLFFSRVLSSNLLLTTKVSLVILLLFVSSRFFLSIAFPVLSLDFFFVLSPYPSFSTFFLRFSMFCALFLLFLSSLSAYFCVPFVWPVALFPLAFFSFFCL